MGIWGVECGGPVGHSEMSGRKGSGRSGELGREVGWVEWVGV